MGIYIKTLFYFLLIIVTCSIKETDAECSITSGGIYTFGPKCEYMCHCKYGQACDSVTGDCQNGCDKNWFGPGCQYRDLAESQVSRHLDNVPQYRWASRANDGDVTTCSETNYASTRRTKNPWWRVWFPNTETITSLEFLTTDEHLKYFKSFKVTIENIPERESTNANYYPPSEQLCYQHSNDVPTDRKIYVICDKPLKGNLVRIQLASVNTQLVLCDVRINGGRNMAFMKQVTRSSGADEDMYPPGNIVDGILRNDSWNDCFVTAPSSSVSEEWLAVNIGHLSSIKMVRITYYKFNVDNIRYYKLYVSNTTERSDTVIVHDDSSFIPTREITLDVTGRYVGVTRQNIYQTVVCEMEIFGDCLFGKYGYNCDLDCSTHCEGGFSRCYHVNGTCLLGCEAGWEGELCDKECEPGNWGKDCQQHCGKCLYGTCDKVNGQCKSGCAAGYKETTYCTEECDNNTFGINCAVECSLNCQDVCDKANGKCDSCNAGWKGNNCTEECSAGTWGESCLDNCGMCLNGTCNRFNGKCTGGCKPGYRETDMCTQQCPAGRYGTGCSGVCSTNCKVTNTCNHEDGKCDSCKSGKQGDFCDQGCERGSYGEYCQQSCGACAMNETCDRVTGYCTQGCGRRYKHSLLCDTECDDGTYGENCTKTCRNCKQGTFCNKVTGICLAGCAEGYKPGVCQEVADQTETSALLQISVGGLASFIVGAVVLISAGIIITACVCRRKNESAIRNVGRKPVAEITVSFPKVQEPAAETVTVEMKESTYEVIRVSREEEHEYEISQDRTLT